MENLEHLETIPWVEDTIREELAKASTNAPDIVEETAISTVIIIVVAAVVSITLLFVMALVIDCRHQKLAKIKQKTSKRVIRIKVPKFRPTTTKISEDVESFADKMHTQEPTPSPASVIV